MFVVTVKSGFAFDCCLDNFGDCGGGESVIIIPPGPFGTFKNDLPKNNIEVGIPVIHDTASSSAAMSAWDLCFCNEVSLPWRNKSQTMNHISANI